MDTNSMYKLTIIIPTYNRPDILMRTINGLVNHIKYDDEMLILIGDDGDNHANTIQLVDESKAARITAVYPGPRNGLGANLNNLLRAAPTEYIMQLDDDHLLTADIDINDYMHQLSTDSSFGWIRLFMGLKSDSDNKKTYYKFKANTHGRYWRIDPRVGSLYVVSNRPHLKKKDFHRRYGLYSEGVKLGEQETLFCHRFRDNYYNDGQLDVFVPMYLPPVDAWEHIGESWQKKGL